MADNVLPLSMPLTIWSDTVRSIFLAVSLTTFRLTRDVVKRRVDWEVRETVDVRRRGVLRERNDMLAMIWEMV